MVEVQRCPVLGAKLIDARPELGAAWQALRPSAATRPILARLPVVSPNIRGHTRSPFASARIGAVGALGLDLAVAALDDQLGVAVLASLGRSRMDGLFLGSIRFRVATSNGNHPPFASLDRGNRNTLSCGHLRLLSKKALLDGRATVAVCLEPSTAPTLAPSSS